ncbi:MAG: hypothetical protein KGN16_08220 [Burkholderiales bacterium]|nr:hypothetical protein [Burkholderiales bacterium]
MQIQRIRKMMSGLLALCLGLTLGAVTPGIASAQEPALAGATLFQDVKTYSDFGVHRYGSTGEQQALAWISKELAAAGLKVERQPLQMGRQLVVDKARVSLGDQTVDAFPLWWPPEHEGPVVLDSVLKPDDDAAGAIAWLRLPYERGAYLNAQHRQKIMELATHKPLAILLTIANPAGSIFTYNVTQEDAPWPMPVILVPARLAADLEAGRKSGLKVGIELATRVEREVASYNVIGRIDHGADRTIVVSTPVSSWFTSSCERGPGIALFLAMARHAASRKDDVNYLFVATVGHEIGHGGMEAFLHAKAPPPEKVRAWLHFGASLACYGWKKDAAGGPPTRLSQPDPALRVLLASESIQALTARVFAEIPATPYLGAQSGVGELRDVRAAGYANYFGMAGIHRYFHTPEDRLDLTGPELLAPLAEKFAQELDGLAAH